MSCKHCEDAKHNHNHIENKKFKIFQIILGILLLILGLLFDNLILFICSYIVVGYEVIFNAFKNIFKGEFFDENFLMTLATICAFIVGEYDEAIVVMILYQIGEFLTDIAVDKSHASVENLLELKDIKIIVVENNNYKEKEITDIKIGDVILVKANERVPLDGELISDSTKVNMYSINGKNELIDVTSGNKMISGSINIGQDILMKVITTYDNSTVHKILHFIEDSTLDKSKSHKFVNKFAKIYTPIVVGLALLIIFIPLIVGWNLNEYIHKACLFLVVACPCAIVISIPLAYYIGTGVSSKNGLLVKGLNYLEILEKVDNNSEAINLLQSKEIYKATVKIIKENIIIVCLVKAFALIWGLFGELPMWVALLSDTGICLIAIANSLRLFRYSK